MRLAFDIAGATGAGTLDIDIASLVIAGWAGRDRHAIEHHIEELAAIGVPRPSTVPLYYRVSESLLTQASRVQVVGGESSGEVEVFLFQAGGELFVSLASDHTDRKLETVSVALSKQVCAKPVAQQAWRFADVTGHWDELVIRSYIVENGTRVVYQEGPLAALQPPLDLVAGFTGGAAMLPEGTAMLCGTVGANGGIRPAASFAMELFDPRSGRTLSHGYDIEVLPEIA